MNALKKTYSFLSAVVLFLFLNSLILPAGLSAVSLYCNMNMEMGVGHDEAQTCFGVHSAETHGDMFSSDKEACLYHQICTEVVSLQKYETEAVTQLYKSVAALLGYIEDTPQIFDSHEVRVFAAESTEAYSSLPIFLLNSVFLN